ncbi:hypothetical protein MBLNU459_g8424t1 [Dothideomycetes sp. NU459]
MDFLKSCTTNLQAVDGFSTIEYQIYIAPAPPTHDDAPAHQDRACSSTDASASPPGWGERRHAILVDLRRRRVLAQHAFIQEKICVFGGFKEADDYLHGLNFKLSGSGRLDVSALARPNADPKIDATNKSIYAMFLSAVEESLTITLANICNAIRVAHLTWLVPTEVQGDAYLTDDSETTTTTHSILTLRVQVTAYGVLLLLPEVAATNLATLSGGVHDRGETAALAAPASTVLVAPSGMTARLADKLGSLSMVDDQTEGTKTGRQARREARIRLARQAKDDAWKTAVSQRLGSLSAIPSNYKNPSQWVSVHVCGSKQPDPVIRPFPSGLRALWPESLCFKTLANRSTTIWDSFDGEWPKFKKYEDPLKLAETWLLGSSERDEVAAARQKLLQVDEDKDTADLPPAELPTDQLSLASPVYFRGQDQASVNGIYPTPPDGLVPGAPVEQNAASTAAAADSSVPQDVVEEDVLATRRPSNSSTQGGFDADDYRKQETDELFGDMDEEMFGAPDADVDITDADFSFFDDGDASGLLKLRKGSSQRAAKFGDTNPPAEASLAPTNPDSFEKEQLTSATAIGDAVDPKARSSPSAAGAVAGAEDQDGDETPHEPPEHILVDEEPVTRPSRPGDRPGDSPPRHAELAITASPPLSPFHIKETLLPSPIPASTSRMQDCNAASRHARRDSNFQPVVFRNDISAFDAKYRLLGRFNSQAAHSNEELYRTGSFTATPTLHKSKSIALPQRPNPVRNRQSQSRKTSVPSRAAVDSRLADSLEELDTISDEDLSSDQSDNDSIISQTASIVKKRKRDLDDDAIPAYVSRGIADLPAAESDLESTASDESSVTDPNAVLDWLLPQNPQQKDQQSTQQDAQHKFSDPPLAWRVSEATTNLTTHAEGLWDIFDFGGSDMISVAQLVAKFLVGLEPSATDAEEQDLKSDGARNESEGVTAMTSSTAQDAVQSVFSLATDCDFTKLAMIISTHADKAARGQTQPRPAVRRPNGPSVTGGHLFTMPAPSVHVRRAGSKWEMLPSALNFWEPLGLEPAGGPKDLNVYAIYPSNVELEGAVSRFLDNIKMAYENCRFGSHFRGAALNDDLDDGLVPFQMPGDLSARAFFQSLYTACVGLGDDLRDETTTEMDCPTVIYIVNPFEEPAMGKYICACFWAFCRAYTETLDPAEESIPDFVLQVVSMESIAPRNSVAVLDAAWLSSLARRIYDHSPVKEPPQPGSPWVISTWPSVQLAQPLPRKVHFVLHDQVPKSLLEEAQILHVAYAISTDDSWLAAAWSDTTGKYQYSASYYLRDTDSKSVLSEIRDMTLGIAKSGPWRIFVARVGALREWEKQVWKERLSDHWAITLLDVDTNPTLRIISTPDPVRASALFMTPASTPQSTVNTGSPMADTPALSADGSQQPPQSQQDQVAAANPPPADPDSYLVDTTDETWGLVLPFSPVHSPLFAPAASRALASGVLLKRGAPSASSLPSLGVDVVDTIAPRLAEGQSNWLMPRAHDAVLREVLNWYRGLGLLARVRQVKGSGTGVVPLHVLLVQNAVDVLAGFMD